MENEDLEWTLGTRRIDDIYPNPKNPRKISKRQAKELQNSLKKFGLCQPIVLNRDGSLIGGHQRLSILRKLGRRTVDVLVPSKQLTQEEEDELSIRLNKNIGTFDDDLLGNHWEPERLLEWGFTMEELHLESIPGKEESATKFSIIIGCQDQDQLELIEKHVASIVDDFSGARYKVKVR